MSMLKAVLKQYSKLPSYHTPIKPGTIPPYGNGDNMSSDLKADELIAQLLGGTLPKDELIDHIDVWGEGRRDDKDIGSHTGFANAYNINLPQGITSGETKGRPIPNLLPVTDYTDTFDLIPNSCVRYVTIMGAPIAKEIAEEMGRILYDYGMIICFGYKDHSTDIENLESALGSNFIRYEHFNPINDFSRISTGDIKDQTFAYVKRGHRRVSWEDGFQTNSHQLNTLDDKHVINLPEGGRVASWNDGYQTCEPKSVIDGTHVVILQRGGKVVSWDDGYQTCKTGSIVDGIHVVILENHGKVVSWDDGYQTCKIGSIIDGTHVVILGNGQEVVSWDTGYKTCRVGSIVDGTNVIIKAVGQEVVSKQGETWKPIQRNQKIDNINVRLAWRLWNSYAWNVILTTSEQNEKDDEDSSDNYPIKDEL